MKAKKSVEAILEKMGIDALNEMQVAARKAINERENVVLLSPTGTGKTLAFLIPIIEGLDTEMEGVQVLILVPSRELAIQIEQVMRDMGSGYKVNAVYGGRAGAKDRMELKHAPTVLVGTPGRVADHVRRRTLDLETIHTLVLDEFDKSLEVGFEPEMKEILEELSGLKKKILTSATNKTKVPKFVEVLNPKHLNFLGEKNQKLEMHLIETHNKIEAFKNLLGYTKEKRGIVFFNLKDTLFDIADYMDEQAFHHVCFYGGMDQVDREEALIQFRNGSSRLLLATDLAARGIDIPALDFIIHFELPMKEHEFIHRNGRTARMHESGVAYILKEKKEERLHFIKNVPLMELDTHEIEEKDIWTTLFISGGRRDKISKGDIAGLFFKQGGLEKNELGIIELKNEFAYVSVPFDKAPKLIEKLNNTRLKKKKVKIREVN